ncbi:hypothetical protein PVAG01_05477 [Phlyctema vagabunda]|uniref:Uncharacterized protein n=1 Tax=Phlyctema vagabunda TaxID=108571 RepID=A0ABR4PK96_9HELO
MPRFWGFHVPRASLAFLVHLLTKRNRAPPGTSGTASASTSTVQGPPPPPPVLGRAANEESAESNGKMPANSVPDLTLPARPSFSAYNTPSDISYPGVPTGLGSQSHIHYQHPVSYEHSSTNTGTGHRFPRNGNGNRNAYTSAVALTSGDGILGGANEYEIGVRNGPGYGFGYGYANSFGGSKTGDGNANSNTTAATTNPNYMAIGFGRGSLIVRNSQSRSENSTS